MTDASETTKTPAKWTPGMRSPNPSGRPPGPSKQKRLLNRMLNEAGGILDAMLAKAREGDPAAAGLILNRIVPALRSQVQPVHFNLDPSLPLAKQTEQVLAAMSQGELAPDVGKQVIDAIGALGNLRAIEQLEERVAMLEARQVN